MKFMLPWKHLTEPDKRALSLYLLIALLSAACVAFGMLYRADFRFGKKADLEQPPTTTPKPTPSRR
jgi:hypothetical protein